MQRDPALIDRDAAVAAMRAGLRNRSGQAWSVRTGRGSVANWITIIAPPARLGPNASMTPKDCAALAKLLGLRHVHPQGVMIESSQANWAEYVMRASSGDTQRAELGQAGQPNAMPSRGPRPIGGHRGLAGPADKDLAL